MRLIWTIIPLTLIGIIGLEESNATAYISLERILLSDNTVPVNGTVISSKLLEKEISCN